MAKTKTAQRYTRAGKRLACPICEGTKFYYREAQLNTRMMSFLDLDFLNPKGDCYICQACRHIMWFYSERARL